jgi:2-polyprenyl-6-methoxyphenol hydroxylase-like FAD-dependent oxidoreductase
MGAGPGGVSAALAAIKAGYDVRIYEKNPEPKPIGGAVLLSVPVLAVLRSYGMDIEGFGSFTRTEFRNHRGKTRVALDFNPMIEEKTGIPGWHYGVLRSSAFARMLALLPEGMVHAGHAVTRYDDHGDSVTAHFENGEQVKADILVGADGIRSPVTTQAFGDPGLFHVGIRVWLAWCEHFDGIPPQFGAIHHSRNVQASYFPMLHDGKPGFEWWIVEKSTPTAKVPSDPEAHLRRHLAHFADPLPRFADQTDFARNVFRWEVYNRPSLPGYTKGRMAGIGDAVHPVSPYAAYGMGMAIEDGYYLIRALDGRDLTKDAVADAFARYDRERVAYCNHQCEIARTFGKMFHHLPRPLSTLRDAVFDHTGFLNMTLKRDYLADAEKQTLGLSELHLA